MLRYNVRSRQLVDLVNAIKDQKLILAPHFQRKLVWRLTHKVDFIKTILLGFPFPEIFLARGGINVDTMESTSCLVDGQQRMNSIVEYINGVFPVDGKTYSELSPAKKEAVLKYEIAIVELDLEKDDPSLLDIFKRLNRTFYALSTIEKMSSEFGSSEFMLVAKLLCGELMARNESAANVDQKLLSYDPNITEEFTKWGNSKKIDAYQKFILESSIFSKYEISRQVQLMFTLNLMATRLSQYYNRNDKVGSNLEEHADEFIRKDEIVQDFNVVASFYNKLRLGQKSYWYTKSNSFSLFLVLLDRVYEREVLEAHTVKQKLVAFEKAVPEDYALAAKEGVNNTKERILRRKHIEKLLGFVQAPE